MGRLAYILALLFTLAPAAALANPASDSVGMTATVVQACTISPATIGAAAARADAQRGLVALGCGDDDGARFDLRAAEPAGASEQGFFVRYERNAEIRRDGSRSVVATIIF